MNRKSDFTSQKIPRLTLEVGDRVLQTEYNGHELGKRSRPEEKQLCTSTCDKKPNVIPKAKSKSKIIEGQMDIRKMLKPRTVASGSRFERGGGQGGRDNLPLPSSTPSALPPHNLKLTSVDSGDKGGTGRLRPFINN